MTERHNMTETQRFLFDTFGYLVLPDVLTNDQVMALRSSLRQPTEQFQPIEREEGPLHWGVEWRDLIDLPKLSPVLEDLIGNHGLREARLAKVEDPAAVLPTFRLDHVNIHTHVTQGFPGGVLHGGWKGTGGSQFFSYHDGQFYNGLVAVSFELFDTTPNEGGFCCIPGSHKSNLPLPKDWANLEHGVHDSLTRLAAKPGDAIVFTEALIHGTLPWTSPETRQTVFYKFSPNGTTWSGDYFDPDDFRQYADMDDRKLAILEPPNARYPGRPTRPERLSESQDH